MAFKYKIDVIKALNDRGYNFYNLRRDKLLSVQTVTNIRDGQVVGIKSLDTLCKLLNCDIGDIIEYVPDDLVDFYDAAHTK